MILLTYISSMVVIGTGCFILGLYVLFTDKKSRINRLFFVNSLLLNTVIILIILIQLQNIVYHVKLFQILYNIVLILFLIESLYFNLVFTKQKLNPAATAFILVFTVVVFFIFIVYGSELLEISRMRGLWVYKLINLKFWFLIYSPYLTIITSLMLFYLFRFSRNALLKKEKLQAKTIMISILAAFAGGFSFLMILPLIKIYKAPLLTPYFFAMYLYGIFFTITKYKFLSFNIRDIAHEALTHVQDIILILKPDNTVINSNGNLEKALSEKSEFLKGKNFTDIIENKDEFSLKIIKFLKEQTASFSIRIDYKSESGTINTESYISKVSDRFGDFAAILIVSRINKGIKQFQIYFKITARELELIYLTISGFTNKEISLKLSITERTVEAHLNNVYNKLGIRNKIELVRMSGDFGIKPAQGDGF